MVPEVEGMTVPPPLVIDSLFADRKYQQMNQMVIGFIYRGLFNAWGPTNQAISTRLSYHSLTRSISSIFTGPDDKPGLDSDSSTVVHTVLSEHPPHSHQYCPVQEEEACFIVTLAAGLCPHGRTVWLFICHPCSWPGFLPFTLICMNVSECEFREDLSGCRM